MKEKFQTLMLSLAMRIVWFMPFIILAFIFSVNSFYKDTIREYSLQHTIQEFVEKYNTRLPMVTYQKERIVYMKSFLNKNNALVEEIELELASIKEKEADPQYNSDRGIFDMENSSLQNGEKEDFVLSICTRIKKIKEDYYSFEYITSKCDAKNWVCERPRVHIGSIKVGFSNEKTRLNPTGVSVEEYYDNRI